MSNQATSVVSSSAAAGYHDMHSIPTNINGDLNYLARPENYGGSSQSMMHYFHFQQKQVLNSASTTNEQHLPDLMQRKKSFSTKMSTHNTMSMVPNSLRSTFSEINQAGKKQLISDSTYTFFNNTGTSKNSRISSPHTLHTVFDNTGAHELPQHEGTNVNKPADNSAQSLNVPEDLNSRSRSNSPTASGLLLSTEDLIRRNQYSWTGETLLPGSKPKPQIMTDHLDEPDIECPDSDCNQTITINCSTLPVAFDFLNDRRPSNDNDIKPNLARRNTFSSRNGLPFNKAIPKQLIRQQIRDAIKVVVIILRWISTLVDKERKQPDEEKTVTFTDLADSFHLDNDLSFDVTFFRARNQEMSITKEVKKILSQPPSTRSLENIKTAIYGLQDLKSFAEYPLHMQEKICKVGWYQLVHPKKVIIRQGHLAENFYFILSGQAMVKFIDSASAGDSLQARTAAVLRKGSSFGELALMHHSRRTATVVSQDVIQLLTIGREDFFNIIMGQILPSGYMPDHVEFLSSVAFMRGWPIETLVEQPQHCMFNYFKRGTVMVKDSNNSEWIYVIKTGSCQVLKELSPVPKTAKRQGEQDPAGYVPHLQAAIEFASISLRTKRPATAAAALVPSDPSFNARSRRLSRPNRKRPDRPTSTRSDRPTRPISAAKLDPVFVHVETLKQGDVFGLRSISFEQEYEEKQSSVILISNGAECVMLSKKCFMDHATTDVQCRFRRHIRPYPRDEVLQNNLRTQTEWDVYKMQLSRQSYGQIKKLS